MPINDIIGSEQFNRVQLEGDAWAMRILSGLYGIEILGQRFNGSPPRQKNHDRYMPRGRHNLKDG